MTTSYTLTGDLASLLGGDVKAPRHVKVTLSTNLGDVALVDLDANEVRLSGTTRVDLTDDLTFSLSLIATNSTGTNVTDGTLRYKVDAIYRDANNRELSWTSGYFALTADADLSDKVGGAGDLDVTVAPSPSLIDAATASNVDSPSSETRTKLNTWVSGRDNAFGVPQTIGGAAAEGALLKLKPTHEDGYAQLFFYPEQGVNQDVGIVAHRDLSGSETLHQHLSFYTSPSIGGAPVARMNIEYGVADAKVDFSRCHIEFDVSAAPGAGGGYMSRVVLKNNGAVAAWNSEGTNLLNLINLNGSEQMEIGSTSALLTGLVFFPGAAEKMRLTSTGRLGIGTNNPARMVEVAGTDAAVRLRDTGSGWDLRTFGGDFSVYDIAAGAHRTYFSTTGAVYFNGAPGSSQAFISSSGEYENTGAGEGIILKSPDGTRYRVTVANGGTIAVAAA